MTRDEILEMQPGRELDELVAEKVMGYEIGVVNLGEWHPSTDISAAWEVFEWLLQKHDDATLTYPWCVAADYNPCQEETWRIHSEGDTAPEAICKAALLAVMDA